MITGMGACRSIDIIIPAKDEAAVVERCVREIGQALAGVDVDWAITLVDDGSQDGTAAIWSRLMAEDPRLGLVQLAGNYGKEAALLAGLRHAQADAVIPMDADLQDPPGLLPAMVAQWRAGCDQVVAVRSRRDDPLWKRIAADLHYHLLGALSRQRHLPQAGDFRLMDRSVVERLLAMPEVDRYTKGLYTLAGGRVSTIAYDRPARAAGRPAQGLGRLVSLSLDGITGFTDAPLRMLLPVGVGAALFGLAYLVYLLASLAVGRSTPPGYPTIICLILVFGGIQVAALGLIGEYIARIYRESKRRPPYFITRAEPPASRRPRS